MKISVNESQRVKVLVNFIIIFVSLWGFAKKDMKLEETTFFDKLIIESFAHIQSNITSVHRGLFTFFEHYINNVNASKKNIEIKNKLIEIEKEVFDLQQISRENIRLKKLLEFGEEFKRKKILAQIVGRDASSDFKVLRINKGYQDGIRIQNTVITSEGIVGYIYRLTDHFSDVLTILDPNHRVDVLIERTRSHGILEGLFDWKCFMKYVMRTDRITLNDLVITSGLGNIYPKGLKVGKVSKVERESYGMTQYLEITPTVDFLKLEEVIVLVTQDKMRKKLEWEVLDRANTGNLK